MNKILSTILGISLFLLPQFAAAQSTVPQGGTGSTTLSGILYGIPGNLRVQSVTVGSGCTFVAGTLACAGTGGGIATTTLSGTGGISVSNSPLVIGGTPAVISCPTCTLNGVTSVTATAPIFSTGGATPVISWAGLATTSQPASSNLLVSNGGAGVYGVATGTVSAGSSAITVTAGRATIGGALAIDCATASGSQNGCLSSTDWTTFNNKVSGVNLWVYANNAVSTSSPVLITASTTIGNGTQTGGLTIFGGATTTGTAYFVSKIGIGTTSPYTNLSVQRNYGAINPTVFAVASSTASDGSAASSLFTVSSAGAVAAAGSITGNSLISNAAVTLAAANTLTFNNSTRLAGAADGQLTLENFAQTDFSRLQFGGTSNAFPSLRRDGAGLSFRLADDSGYASTSVSVINALSTVASSTFSNGINLTTGCFAVNGTCLSSGGSGTVTSVATTYPVTGGPFTTSGTIALAFGTTTANMWSQLQIFGTSTAASSRTLQSNGAVLINTGTSATAFQDLNIGGVSGWTTGESHSINFVFDSANNTANKINSIQSSYDGTYTYLNFRDFNNAGNKTDILMTVRGDGNVGVASSSPQSLFSIGTTNGINFSQATSTFYSTGGINLTKGGCFAVNGTCLTPGGSGTVTSIATNNGITGGTITTTGTIGLAAIAANSVLGNITGASAVPVAVATSSLFNIASNGVGGILSSTEWAYIHTATSTFSAPLVYTLATNAVTCTNASNGVTGCMSATDWGLLHTASTTFSGPLSYSLATNAVTCPTCNTSSATVTSVATTYPVTGGTFTTSGTIALAFGTTTANTWSSLQTFTNGFISNASSTVASGLFRMSGGASTTNATASGTMYANNFYDTSAAGSSCIGDSGGILENGNCVASLASAGGSLTISSPTGNVDASINTAHSNSFSVLQSFANATSTLFTCTTCWATTGLTIPSATSPTVTASGAIAINTTAASTSVQFGSSGTQYGLFNETPWIMAFATTTTAAGTTTVGFSAAGRDWTATQVTCTSQDSGTWDVQFGNGTASTTMVVSDTSGTTQTFTTLSSNNTFTYRQKWYIAYGTPSATSNRGFSCTLMHRYTN